MSDERVASCDTRPDPAMQDDDTLQGTSESNVQTDKEQNTTPTVTILTGPCGIGPCTPDCMQKFNNIKFFTFLFTIIGLISSSLGSYFVTQITTLEKEFGLTSSKSSLLISCREIGYLLSVLLFSHLGRYFNRPRMIAGLSMLFIPSLIIMLLPHIILMFHKVFIDFTTIGDDFFNPIVSSSPYYGMCTNDTTPDVPDIPFVVQFRDTAFALLITAVVLEGIAKGPRYSLAMSYIDDNLDKTKTGLYFGIIMFASTFGPGLSFGLGAVTNTIYVTLEETPLKENDPRWIGAWWFGYMLLCIPTILLATTLFFFPKHICKEISEEEKQKLEKPFAAISVAKEFPRLLWRLLRNPIYMIVSLTGCLHAFAIASIITYFPKFCEQYFHASASKASIMLGSIMLSGAAFGVLGGGLVTRYMKLSLKGCLTLIFIASLVDGLGILGVRAMHCDAVNPLGHPNISSDHDLNTNITHCNSHCNCSDQYFPICGSDSRTYYSPCHAGCQDDGGNLFSNCSCIEPQFGNETATPGLCEDECDMFPIFLSTSFFGAAISTLTVIPTMVAQIRAVSPEDKTFALGFATILTVVLGSLLSPIVMGNLIDTACEIWEYIAGIRGACQLYNSDGLNQVYTFTVSASFLMEAALAGTSLIIFMACRKSLLKDDRTLPKEKKTVTSYGYSNEGATLEDSTH